MLRRIRYFRRFRPLREEMEAHIVLAADDFEAQGMTRKDAELAARRRFGSVALHAEQSRDVWALRWMDDLLLDLRYTLRSIRRDPGFAVVAALSAALAIGACTTVFSVANFALLQSLPVQDPSRLISISAGPQPGDGGNSMSYPTFTGLRENFKAIDGLAAAAQLVPGTLSIGAGEAKNFWGSLVSANFFDVVKPRFALGSGFRSAADDTPGAPPVVVISHALWRDFFYSDQSIVGTTINFNRLKATVIGVTAPGFRGTHLALVEDFWIPFSMRSEHRRVASRPEYFANAGAQWLLAVGRLAPGADLEQARSEAAVISARLQASESQRFFHLETAGRMNASMRKSATTFFSLAAAVTLVILLIACANVANLLLARGEKRHKEINTRLALGASRGRLIRQSLAESTVLAVLGGIPGLLLAYWGTQALNSFRLPVPLPIDLTVTLDARVALFCFALCLVTGLLFGLIPALRTSRARLVGAPRAGWLRRSLVVLQVSAALLLLIGSGLFLRSLNASESADLGINERNVLMVNFDPDQSGYTPDGQVTLLRTLLSETVRLNGALSAAVTRRVPLSFGTSTGEVESIGPTKEIVRVNINRVTPGYFETLGIGLRQGQTFRGESGSIIIDQYLADRLFSGSSAEGQSLRYEGRVMRIIGVVADSKSASVSEDRIASIYLPLLEAESLTNSKFGLTLLIRTSDRPYALAESVRGLFRRLDRTLVPRSVQAFDDHVRNSLFLPRLGALLFGLCGGMGLLIASIGVYGVISFSVARRTKEIGIRMALGAARGQVVRMVLWEGLQLALIGVAIGIAGGVGFGKVARSLLYGVSSTDPATFIAVPLLLLAVAATATLLPARRAVNTSPTTALRSD